MVWYAHSWYQLIDSRGLRLKAFMKGVRSSSIINLLFDINEFGKAITPFVCIQVVDYFVYIFQF